QRTQFDLWGSRLICGDSGLDILLSANPAVRRGIYAGVCAAFWFAQGGRAPASAQRHRLKAKGPTPPITTGAGGSGGGKSAPPAPAIPLAAIPARRPHTGRSAG